MAADGSQGPRPYTQRQARTLFLRVPHVDWVAVARGVKREFRASPKAVSKLWSCDPPTPVVAYRQHPAHGYDRQLMVLEATWIEPIGAITPESLEAEGFNSLAEFRRYFMARERSPFRPTRKITVYKVRLWVPEVDDRRFAERLFDHLYGAFTDPEA